MCPSRYCIRLSNSGVKYSPYRLAMNSGMVNAGCEITRTYRLCSSATSSSRGPRGRPLPAGRRARSARVIGAPSSSRIGTSIDSTMCCIMWALNSTMP